MIRIDVFCEEITLPYKKIGKNRIRATASAAAEMLDLKDASITIVVTGDRYMRKINREFRDHDEPTDVISFSNRDNPFPAVDDTCEEIGDIYISIDRADRQSREFRVSLQDELKRLMADFACLSRKVFQAAALTDLDADERCRAIVLWSQGKHFCAGHDIGTPGRDVDQTFERKAVIWWDHTDKKGGDLRFARESEVYLGMCRRWREIPKPVIAMVHGACIAGGLMLAWSADFIIASDDAFFSDPVVRMGIPGVEYFAHPWVMNPRAAKEFLFSGDRFSAQRAQELGMVNQVVPADELESTVLALAGRISQMPRFGLALTKKAVNQAEDLQGMRAGMDSVFGLHHFAHAHNAEVGADSLGGLDAKSMAAKNKEQGKA